MNIKYIRMVVREKVCPSCSVGMTREVGRKIYQCDHSRCGERFDLSHLTEEMINALLEKKGEKKHDAGHQENRNQEEGLNK